mgnify:CR=1 FL=1
MNNSKLSPPYITDLSLNSVNDAIMDIYRNLNILKDSADEITFELGNKGEKRLLVKTGNGTIDLNNEEKQIFKVRDLRLTGTIWGSKYVDSASAIPRLIQLPTNENTVIGKTVNNGLKLNIDGSMVVQEESLGIFPSPTPSNTNAVALQIVNSGDTKVEFVSGGTVKWSVGNDSLTDAGSVLGKFKIQNLGGTKANFSDTSELELDGDGNLAVQGTLTSSNGVCGGTGDSGNSAIYDNSGTPAFKSGITKAEVQTLLNVSDGANANVSGDSGNAAIYDNSGTPALKSGITSAEVTALMSDATGINKGIAAFTTTDFSISSGVISNKYKQVFSSEFAGRYNVGTADAYITGYPGYWVKSTNTGIHTGQDTTDVTLGVDYVKYCLMMPESGTVTGFVSDCEWDNANGEIDVDLWKVDAIADTGSALTSVALDHIARITFTDPSDTTYYKALADNGGLDATGKVFTAGESLLVTGMSEDSSDGSSIYLRPIVTVVFDS